MRKFINLLIIVSIILTLNATFLSCKRVITTTDINLTEEEISIDTNVIDIGNYDITSVLEEKEDKILIKALPAEDGYPGKINKSYVFEYDFKNNKSKEISAFDLNEEKIITDQDYSSYFKTQLRYDYTNRIFYHYIYDEELKPIAVKSCGDNILTITGNKDEDFIKLEVNINNKIKIIDDKAITMNSFSKRIDNHKTGNYMIYIKEIDNEKRIQKLGIYDICNDKLNNIQTSLDNIYFLETENYLLFYTYEDYFTNTLEIVSKKDFNITKKLFLDKSILYGGHYDEDIIVIYDKYVGKIKIVNLSNFKNILEFYDHNLLMDNCIITKDNNLISIYLFPYIFADGIENKFLKYTFNLRNRSLSIKNIFTPRDYMFIIGRNPFGSYFLESEDKFICFAKDVKKRTTNLVVMSLKDSKFINYNLKNYKLISDEKNEDGHFFSSQEPIGMIINNKYLIWSNNYYINIMQ